jgi:hypothetical protein
MKNQNDVQKAWEQQQANYFSSAVEYYELDLLDEAETELNKIDASAAVDSIPILALRLNICFGRKQWNKMAALATYLLLLDQFNPRWACAHGWATAKIDSEQNQAKRKQKAVNLIKLVLPEPLPVPPYFLAWFWLRWLRPWLGREKLSNTTNARSERSIGPNEKEISHGRVLWQTRLRLFGLGVVIASIG